MLRVSAVFTGAIGIKMREWYLICEKRPKGKVKFLSVVHNVKVGRNALRRFAERSPHEVYLMDVLTKKVVLRLNPH